MDSCTLESYFYLGKNADFYFDILQRELSESLCGSKLESHFSVCVASCCAHFFNFWGNVKMYENIGGKIKSVAVGTFIVEAISAVFSGIAIIVSGEAILLGLLLIIVGPIAAWVGTLILYGFGELVENSEYLINLRSNLQNENYNNESYSRNDNPFTYSKYDEASDYNHRHNLYNVSNKRKACSKCGNIVTERDDKCRCCGTEVKW